MKLFRWKGSDAGSLPDDKIQRSFLQKEAKWATGATGIPATADCCAYDPIQRLLAVSTTGGLVKVFGKDGVEQSLVSSDSTFEGTTSLAFLPGRGALLRVSKAGQVDLWSLTDCKTMRQPDCRLDVPGDPVTATGLIRHSPYILLGCESGIVRVGCLTSSTGGGVSEGRECSGLKLTPYEIHPHQLAASGHVVSLDCVVMGPVHQLLAVHSATGGSVWDLRAQELVCVVDAQHSCAPTGLQLAGEVTCGCWLPYCTRADFCTGHSNGALFFWGVEDPPEDPSEGPCLPLLLGSMRLGDGRCKEIRSVQYLGGKAEQLLVHGGLEVDDTQDLVIVEVPEVPEEMDNEEEAAAMPHADQPPVVLPTPCSSILDLALAPGPGGIAGTEKPAALLVMAPQGEIYVLSLVNPQLQPSQILFSFQAAAPTSCVTAHCIPTTRESIAGVLGVTMLELRKNVGEGHRRALSSESGPKVSVSPGSTAEGEVGWRWLLSGGLPPRSSKASGHVSSTLVVTGHPHGHVGLWDVFSEAPRRLCTLPSSTARDALAQMNQHSPFSQVNKMEFCWQHGLLVTGHAKGQVRVYQFHNQPRDVEVITLVSIGSSSSNMKTVIKEPAGFQLKLVVALHSVAITSIHYHPGSKFVVVGDDMGAVSLLDLSRPAVLWYLIPQGQAVVDLKVAKLALPPPRDRSPALTSAADSHAGAPWRCVVVLGKDSRVSVLDALQGVPIGREAVMQPKHLSKAIMVEVLDEQGGPCWLGEEAPRLGPLPGKIRPAQISVPKEVSPSKGLGSPGKSPQRVGRSPPPSPPAHQGAGYSEGPLGEGREGPGPLGEGSQSQRKTSHSVMEWQEVYRAASQRQLDGKGEEDEETLHQDRHAPQVSLVGSMRQLSLGSDDAGGLGESDDEGKGPESDSQASASAVPPSRPQPAGAEKRGSSLAEPHKVQKPPLIEISGRTPSSDKENYSPRAKAPTSAQASVITSESPTRSSYSPPRFSSVPSTTLATFLVIASSEFLRIYSLAGVIAGDRTTVKKIPLAAPLVGAWTFQVKAAPALVCVLRLPTDYQVQIYTLPNLVLLCECPWSSLVHEGCSLDQLGQEELCASRQVACTLDGEIVWLGQAGDLRRIGLSSGLPSVLPPESLYDWDLAAAANAASIAHLRRRSMDGQQPGTASGGTDNRSKAATAPQNVAHKEQEEPGPAGQAAQQPPFEGSTSPSGRRRSKKGPALFKFVAKVQADLQKAGNEISKGLQKAIDETQKGLQKVAQVIVDEPWAKEEGLGPHAQRAPPYPYPDLHLIFSGKVDLPMAKPGFDRARSGGECQAGMQNEDQRRAELLSGAEGARGIHPGHEANTPKMPTRAPGSPSAPPATRLRTASEIRAAYGRPAATSKKADEVRSVMEETRQKLGERGEKLAQLQDKTAQLEDTAADFAQLARQLNEREKKKATLWGMFS